MLYAAFELPITFEVVNPYDGSIIIEDLRGEEHIFLSAYGKLDPGGQPLKHKLARFSENFISL